jgi:hypothetical protein
MATDNLFIQMVMSTKVSIKMGSALGPAFANLVRPAQSTEVNGVMTSRWVAVFYSLCLMR